MSTRELFRKLFQIFRDVTHPCMQSRYETTKAGDAVKALKASLKPQATVCRDGKWQSIEAALLVPGDLVLLGSGSHIPADCRVCSGPATFTLATLNCTPEVSDSGCLELSAFTTAFVICSHEKNSCQYQPVSRLCRRAEGMACR